ncbi:MAG TPA: aconitate hydratase [Longimicrobiales bacterium]|nr:aconitate hydratase [Longimicrobiales bacterium]
MPSVAHKLITSHLVDGAPEPGAPIALKVDQTLTQDATGTLVMLELEAMGVDRVKTEVSAQYVDHNLIQADHRNPDDHLFLQSACARFGIWYSRPGNGVSHPVHMERFGVPGKTLLGSDSHTPAAGSLGMLAIGAGGIDVALAMAGRPLHLSMPEIWGVRLTGELPPWVSAKDVILEMLRRHGVDGGLNRIIEYHGPGLASLSAMDRHVIANMGAELGATTTVFPSDAATRAFLAEFGREEDWAEILADDDAEYHVTEELDLSSLEPLIAKPSSPGNVVPVRDVAGESLYQAYIGSSANPGYRDFAIAARMAEGRSVASHVSFDLNPTSRSMLQDLIREGLLTHLIEAGGRLHQAGCNGCIGMGQAPASGQNSLRTTPRNFPGRSGTKEDSVFLCSPETATASALAGTIVDPRDWAAGVGMAYPRIDPPSRRAGWDERLLVPPPEDEGPPPELVKGPNIVSLPDLEPVPDDLEAPVLLKVGDDISTDEILPAGSKILPFRSNIPAIAEFTFGQVDETYPARAKPTMKAGGHVVVGGRNYGQGSSREHAALAPRYLGLRMVIAREFARIHRQNLVNFGVVPATFDDGPDYDAIEQGDVLRVAGLRGALQAGAPIRVENTTKGTAFTVSARLSPRERDVLLAGGITAWVAADR